MDRAVAEWLAAPVSQQTCCQQNCYIIRLCAGSSKWLVPRGSTERFFGRQVDLELLTERVHRGSHTLLTAARRMGKTSLVHELLRQLRETGEFETFYVDLEAAEDHRHAVAEIGSCCASTVGVGDRISRILGGALERVDELSVFDLSVKLRARIDEGNWQHRADEIFDGIASCERPVVLAIDELPVLVNRLLLLHHPRAKSKNRPVPQLASEECPGAPRQGGPCPDR